MNNIISIRDPQIVLPDIVIPLTEEDENNFSQIQQTKVTGVMMPLLAINGIAITYSELLYFKLDWKSRTPAIEFKFIDRKKTFSELVKPGISNELQVQILPAYDDAYKKINMLFYIDKINIENNYITGRAKYKNLDLIQSRFISLGQLSTYELFEKVSIETGLGFATNIESSNDARYIYAPMKNYLEILDKEIERSESGATQVYDYWIDLWNNIVLCDVLDRYSNFDEEEDMMVWTSDSLNQPTTEFEVTPRKTPAVFTNTPAHAHTELYITKYNFNNNPTGYEEGTSKLISIYSEATHDYLDNYTADGDVTQDEFLQFEYGGEFYGDYNYLFAKQCRDMYLRKINSETLSIYTYSPLLGLSRGDQVRVVWYDADTGSEYIRQGLEDAGIPKQSEMDLGWLSNFVLPEDRESGLRLNTNVSGQYTIVGIVIKFENSQWQEEYILGRPAKNKTDLVDLSNT